VRERRIHALRCAGSAQILRGANVLRCAGVVQIRRADASRSVVQGTEMLMREAVLVEETVVGEHRDIISESSRWNLIAAAHKKQRLGHGFGIVRGGDGICYSAMIFLFSVIPFFRVGSAQLLCSLSIC
jgi:hypothetical protein